MKSLVTRGRLWNGFDKNTLFMLSALCFKHLPDLELRLQITEFPLSPVGTPLSFCSQPVLGLQITAQKYKCKPAALLIFRWSGSIHDVANMKVAILLRNLHRMIAALSLLMNKKYLPQRGSYRTQWFSRNGCLILNASFSAIWFLAV